MENTTTESITAQILQPKLPLKEERDQDNCRSRLSNIDGLDDLGEGLGREWAMSYDA